MHPRPTRRALLVAVGAASLAGCLGTDGSRGSRSGGRTSGDTTDTESGKTGERRATTPGDPSLPEAVPVADTRLPVQYEFDRLRKETVSGGPPKDGIPAIDDPAFESPSEADEWLDEGDVVFGVVVGDTARAYPQRILVWHEITNDVVDGTPVSVTYCPLTGTALGFLRGETTFGVSGRLVNSNLVMYDRETDSRWPQMLGTAIEGAYEGQSLRGIPVTWTTWARWSRRHPDTRVLSTDTGYIRNYDEDPYGTYNPRSGYYTNANTLFFPLERDDSHFPKDVFVGARLPEGPVAFRKQSVRDEELVTATVGGAQFVATYDADLDAVSVSRSASGRRFDPDEWTVTENGTVIRNGTVAGGETPEPTTDSEVPPNDRVVAYDAMWFAWAGFYPESVVYG
ncbi:MAG: DUF3179 domain-containing protein [Halobacteriota archaeon]